MQFSRLRFVAPIFFILALIFAISVISSSQIVIDIAHSDQDLTYLGATRGDALSPIATGDFNGDGVKDVLLGAPNAYGKLGERGAGAAYLVLGSSNLSNQVDLEAVGSRVTIFGCNVGDRLGTAVAAGDVNGDGIDDIILGAPGADGPDVNGDGVEDRPNSGEVYVIFGRSDLFFGGKFDICNRDQDVTIFGADPSDNLGAALAVNDINKDSFMDIVIGAPLASGSNPLASGLNNVPAVGKVYVAFGRAFLRPVFPTCLAPGYARCMDMAGGALGPGPNVTVYGSEPGAMIGAAVASGDVNKDGFADLVIGAPLADGPNNRNAAGAVYIFFGRNPFPPNFFSQDVAIWGADPGDQLGSALAIGELNHDGIQDIIIGAPGGDGPNEARPGAGEAYVILGRASFPKAFDIKPCEIDPTKCEQDVTIYGADISDGLGASVALGQIGQDEIDDILIGAPGADSRGNARPRAGEAYIILGNTLLPKVVDTCLPPKLLEIINCASNVVKAENSVKPDIIFFGANTGDRLGSTTYIGDVTGDTIEDIFLGAPNGDGLAELRENSGEVYTILGSPVLENKPPVAEAGPNQPPPTVCVGKPVQLDGSKSSDPEKGLLLFKWEFTKKPTGSFVPDPKPIATPAFIPDKPGTYVLKLTVDDGFGVRSLGQISTVTIKAITCGPVVIDASPFAFFNDHIVMRARVDGVTDLCIFAKDYA